MAKRFTATGKWDDDWFIGLSNGMKLLWIYILDKCDHAGVFKPNFTLASLILKTTLSPAEILDQVNNGKKRIDLLSNGHWFITDFIGFQYGNRLNEKSPAHRGILKVLKEEGLSSKRGQKEVKEKSKRVVDTLKDKDKDKDTDMDKEEDKERFLDFVLLTRKEYESLAAAFGAEGVKERIKNLNDYIGAKGKKYKSHYHTILMWESKDQKSRPVESGYRKP